MEFPQKTILLVEDEAVIGMSEVGTLEGEGYNVVHVLAGEDAIELCNTEEHSIDLILMDIDLGKGIDGTLAAQEILKDHDIPVVFLSSHTEKEVVDRTEKITSYGYVDKNSGATVLAASIKMAFKLHDANRLLRITGHNFLTVFHSNPDAMSISRMSDDMLMDINAAFTDLIGYHRDEAIGRSAMHDINLWVDLEDRTRMLMALGKNGRVDGLETPVRIKDGSVKTLQMSAAKIIYNNEPCVIIVTRDLTERKRAEEKLSAILRQMHDIIEFLPDPTFVIDDDRKVIYWNKAMEDLTGVKKDEVRGQGDYAYALPFYHERRPMMIDLVDFNDSRLEVRYGSIRRVGDRVYGESYFSHLNQGAGAHLWGVASPLYDTAGRKIGAIEVIHDVTGLMKMQNTLRERESLYRLLAENTDDVIWVVDTGLRFTYISPSNSKVFGFVPEESMRQTLEETFTPESVKKIHEIYELYMPDIERGMNPTIRFVAEVYHKNGSTVWVDNTVNILRDSEGRIIGFMGVCKDISERKRMEEDLEMSLRQKEVLMKELQHRVKNNLNVISSLLTLGMDKLHDEQARQVFLDAQSRIRTMSALYDKLVQSNDLNNIDLSLYIKDLANILVETYATPKENIRLSLNLNEVKLDIKRAVPLGLILNELISNSIKYAFPVGMSGEIGIGLAMTDNRIELGVTDNGVGLPEEFSLERADSMGLRLINILTEQIKGRLTIERKRGTSVSLTFDL